ncbi:MAG: alpha-L-arabinofuranosidase C-terminal domain-containing protein [Sedimentisphaerales bacterium]|jgi:alpha-N-arabinofuranosidase
MKNTFFILLLVFPFSSFAQTAKIKIDVDRKIGEIDPKIYGVFMEPIHFSRPLPAQEKPVFGNTLYGPLYDPKSPQADENGFNKIYIEAAKELRITNMRWPGGNYTAGYNWQDGIGPKEKRPVRKELAWNTNENNHVGTDEWVQLNEAIGSENVVCINLGTGTIDDARWWVEYCNCEPGTYYADLRKKYGHEKPFNVKYWCLGNEVDGEPWIIGYKNAEDYCKIAKNAARVMRLTDKSIKLVACGSSNYDDSGKWVDWNWKIINELRDVADYISIHRYWDRSSNYYVYVGQRAIDLEEKISLTASQIKAVRTRYRLDKPIYLSVDEYGAMGRGILPVLAAAQYFNAFLRHADAVKMANYTLFTSLLSFDKDKGLFATPLFHTFKLFSNNCLGNSVDVFTDCNAYDTNECKNIPYLDATAVFNDANDTLFINVVNRHKDEPIETEILTASGTFSGEAVASIVNRDDIYENFTFDKKEEYIPVTKVLSVEGKKITCSFPAHSFVQIKVKIKK